MGSSSSVAGSVLILMCIGMILLILIGIGMIACPLFHLNKQCSGFQPRE